MRKHISVFCILLLLACVLTGCGGEPEAGEAGLWEGQWIGVYLETNGLKLPVSEEEGLTCDLLLEAEGRAVCQWYDADGGHQDVDGSWKSEGENMTLKVRDPILQGTFSGIFSGIFSGDVLLLSDFPGEDMNFALAREGSQAARELLEEVRLPPEG